MRTPPAVRVALLWLACLGFLLPEPYLAAAAEPPRPTPNQPRLRTTDAVLGSQGTLRGQVLDPQGRAVPGARVALFTQDSGGPAAEFAADAQGRFAVGNLQDKAYYLIVGGQGAAIFRVWAAEGAPPWATPEALVVSDGTVVRGQDRLYRWVSEHFFITSAVIAAAIAIPVAVVNGQKHSASP